MRCLEDIKHYYSISGFLAIIDPGLWCILLYRLGNLLFRLGHRKINPFWYIYLIMYYFELVIFKIEIPASVSIGRRLYLPHPYGLVMGGKTTIGDNVKIGPWVILGHNFDHQNPIIGDDCYIGPHACVLGNVRIGKNCIIGANVVITKDIPDNSTIFNKIGRAHV